MANAAITPQAPARQGFPNAIDLTALFQLGSTGAVSNSGAPIASSSSAPSGGAGGLIKAVRNSAGNYTITLPWGIQQVVDVAVNTRIAAPVAGKARDWQLQSVANIAASTPSFVIQGINASDAAADPEDNAVLMVRVTVQANV